MQTNPPGQALIDFLLRQRLAVLLGAVLLLLAGGYAWTRLSIDAFPDVSNNQVMILSDAPGLAAIDVEQRVTQPLEQVLSGLPRVRELRSLSKAELSQVVVVFDDDADVYWARQVVFERLQRARDALPDGIEPELGPISTGLGEVLQYTLSSNTLSLSELRSLQDWLVAPRLATLRGVNEVNSMGGQVKEIHVLVEPLALVEHGLVLDDVVEALRRNNSSAAGGTLVRGWEQSYLRVLGLLEGPTDVEGVALRSSDGQPLTVGDVPTVSVAGQLRQGAITRDGKGEMVGGMVIMLAGENAADLVERAKAELGAIRKSLPEEVELDVYYDRSSLVEACIRTVRDALLEGGLLVVLVLFLFVADLRSALIVLVSLPLTFAASFVLMQATELSSNLMSLGGLAFSVGMVVDASIVVVENVRRHVAMATPEQSRRELVTKALLEVARPVLFSVLVVSLIVLPLFSLQDIEGKMFAPLALTLLFALLSSLVLALTVVPVLCELLLRLRPARREPIPDHPASSERSSERGEFVFSRWLRRAYMVLLEGCLRHPWLVIAVALLSLASTSWLVPKMGTEFMPPLDEGAIAINVLRLPNAALDGSVAVATAVEQRLMAFDEVASVVSKTGRAEISEDPMGPEQSDLIVSLHPRQRWASGRSKAELVEAMREDLEQIPGLRWSFSQPIALRVNELVSGVKSDLAIKLFGPKLEQLGRSAEQIAELLRTVPGAVDVKLEQVGGMRQLDLRVDFEAAARYGIDAETIARTVRTAVAGEQATTLLQVDRFDGREPNEAAAQANSRQLQPRTAVRVRLSEQHRAQIEPLMQLLIEGPDGARIPLSELTQLERVEAPSQLSRENGMRRVVVEANVSGRDLGAFVADVQARLAELERSLPTGYFIEYGGQFENQQRAMAQLGLVVPMALALIVILLYLALGSMGRALLVLLNLPFALVGGVLAAWTFDLPLSVSAAVAFVVLLGVAVQNGVVLVSFWQQLRERGVEAALAIRQGCEQRFRPLLMTALTSFIGHLPMVYATGSGADIQKPLAVVVMGGIISSSLLTLFVLPAMYSLVLRKRTASASQTP